MRILGIDPGSRLMGYGCIESRGTQLRPMTHGTVRVADRKSGVIAPFEDRLLSIYESLSEIILEFKPQVMVVEKVFFAKNALSALKLGQARGAVILTGKIHSLQIFEYSPNEVKMALTGHGHADKEQVAKMIQLLVGQQKFATLDASDGLALAICHAQMTHVLTKTQQAIQSAGLQSLSTKRTKRRMSLAECVGAVVPGTAHKK